MRIFFPILLLCISQICFAQKDYFSHFTFDEADTLRGQLNPMRTCIDVTMYDLFLKIDPNERFIQGSNEIHFTAENDFEKLQIDLFEEMKPSKIVYQEQELNWIRKHKALIIDFPKVSKGTKGVLRIEYSGHPIVAKQAPWDGGFVFSKDENKKDWIGVACEGVGASLWWPNKDHLSDEPDSMYIRLAVPKGLMAVANGNLVKQFPLDEDYEQFDWFVSYPINNYNVTVNIADYAHFSETYTAKDGDTMNCDYYVLKENLKVAKKHFKQVAGVLEAFEHFFGKYPFWNDGFALVETPYLGMEHQSAIAYGNRYLRGYLGGMIPKDMDWDYIIVHETGHEYWGNSISANDHAEMWIHESFTTYMEALYVEYHYDFEKATSYLVSQRPFIRNKLPIIGPLDVNFDAFGSSDHYYKGAWVLHTLRNVIGDDAEWFDLLMSLHQEHAISNMTTEDIVQFINKKTGKSFDLFFEQFLHHPKPPTLVYKLKEGKKNNFLEYKWESPIEDFKMPFLIQNGEDQERIEASTEWRGIKLKKNEEDSFKIRTDLLYIDTKLME